MLDPSPLTELTGYARPNRRIFVKHEHLGTTGSIKDRMVERALLCAIEAGQLKTQHEIVEASSGNTGAALAYAGTKLGFTVHIFVASTVSVEKIEAIKSFGGNVHEVDAGGDQSEFECAKDYALSRNAYLFNQFENPFHVPAYKETIGAELVSQLNDLSVTIEHFVAGVGSGGSIRAVGELLCQSHNKNMKIWAVVPAKYPSDIEGLNPGHLRRQGHFKIWLDRLPGFESGLIEVEDKNAFRETISLKKATGLSVGPASGSCLYAARQLPESGNTLILLTDSGSKYSRKMRSWEENLGMSETELC